MVEHLKWLTGLPFLGWWYQRRRERLNLDRSTFQGLDEVLSEKDLLWFLEQLAGGGYERDSALAVGRYLDETNLVSCDFLDARIRGEHGLYVTALGSLFRFLGPRVAPSPIISSRFQFLPEKNIDIRGEWEDMEEYSREFQDLLSRAERVETFFRRYRRLVRKRLHV